MSDNYIPYGTNCWNCNANHDKMRRTDAYIGGNRLTQCLECGVVWNDITLHAIEELIGDAISTTNFVLRGEKND